MADAAAPRFDLPVKRIAAALCLAVAVTLCGLFEYPYDVWSAGLLFLAWLGLTIALVLKAITFAWPRQQWTASRLAPLMVTGAGIALCYAAMFAGFRGLDEWSTDRNFLALKPDFDGAVAEVLGRRWDRGLHRAEVGDTFVSVDVSDAVRVELSTQGFFGNWEGFYYDPTDAYANGRAHHFDGTVYGCRRVSGHYYYCRYDLETF